MMMMMVIIIIITIITIIIIIIIRDMPEQHNWKAWRQGTTGNDNMKLSARTSGIGNVEIGNICHGKYHDAYREL